MLTVCGVLLLGTAASVLLAAVPEEALPPDMAGLIEEARRQATFIRTLNAPRVAAPVDLYSQVIDLPEVTAPAARRLRLGTETVGRLAQDAYRIENPDGSWAMYRVVHRAPRLRITHATGEFVIGLFSVKGQVWGLLRLEPDQVGVNQSLVAVVLVENKMTAFLTKFVQFVMPGIADHELLRGFLITRLVSEWAHDQPETFCRFLLSVPR